MTFECVICGCAANRWPVNDQCHQCEENDRREQEALDAETADLSRQIARGMV